MHKRLLVGFSGVIVLLMLATTFTSALHGLL